MVTEKQIQAAVTKYRKLKADYDRLYLQVGKAEMRYKEAERKKTDTKAQKKLR